MSDTHATVSEAENILTVTLDRQDKHNAISDEMTAVFWEAVRALADRDDLRTMVITGRGPYFTAGMDLGGGFARRLAEPTEFPGLTFRRLSREHQLLYDEFEAIEKPIILAAQGHCLGAGLEMAVSCDFRFASTEASFGLPEVRIGVIAGSGGTSRMARLIGPHWTKWLAMAGQRVNAEQARSIGLIHDVFPAETFQEQVREFARSLNAISAECLGLAKLAVDMSADVDRTTHRFIDRLANTALHRSAEFQARTARFKDT